MVMEGGSPGGLAVVFRIPVTFSSCPLYSRSSSIISGLSRSARTTDPGAVWRKSVLRGAGGVWGVGCGARHRGGVRALRARAGWATGRQLGAAGRRGWQPAGSLKVCSIWVLYRRHEGGACTWSQARKARRRFVPRHAQPCRQAFPQRLQEPAYQRRYHIGAQMGGWRLPVSVTRPWHHAPPTSAATTAARSGARAGAPIVASPHSAHRRSVLALIQKALGPTPGAIGARLADLAPPTPAVGQLPGWVRKLVQSSFGAMTKQSRPAACVAACGAGHVDRPTFWGHPDPSASSVQFLSTIIMNNRCSITNTCAQSPPTRSRRHLVAPRCRVCGPVLAADRSQGIISATRSSCAA